MSAHRCRPVSASLAVAVLALVAAAGTVSAQAVSEWRTPAGLPVAIVELTGGDVEHLTALVPATTTAPPVLAGWPTATSALPGALLLAVTVPSTVAAQAALELGAMVGVTGCGAVVAVGPVPARELRGPLAGLATVASPLAFRPDCTLADGREEVVRGSDEKVELYFAVPQPSDPRFDSLTAVAALLERRLASGLPGVRVAVERREGCWRLAARTPVGNESARAVLRRLREQLGAAVAAPLAEAEIEAATAPLRKARAELASDGGAIAADLAARLAQGGRAAGSLTPVVPGPGALSELLREVVAGRAGMAVVTEAERRDRPEEPATLANGVIVTTRWLSGDIAVLALAFGSLDPAAAEPLTQAIATSLAAGGWTSRSGEVAGVPVVTAVVPPGDVAETIEALTDALAAGPGRPAGGLLHDVGVALGLHGSATAETLSLALALPADAEEGAEAASKLLSQIPTGGVSSTLTPAGARLVWTPDEAAPQMAAVIEVPPTTAGWLAAEVIAGRAGADAAARAVWLSPAGRLALVLVASGEAHVPALDSRLAAAWARLRRPVAAAELTAASQRLFSRLYGDLPASVAREAVHPFLPEVPPEISLLAPDAGEVNAVLAGLPAWEALLRIARGPAPVLVAPPVRKSPSRPGKG